MCAIREVRELAMQEIDVISAAEKQARACCEQARQQAADLAAQAEKDGAARLLAVSAGAQEQPQPQLISASVAGATGRSPGGNGGKGGGYGG